MTPRGFRWTFASDAVRAELGECPEMLLDSGIEVKENPVRRVIRSGSYFLKCDRRSFVHLRGEWKSAKLLKSHGIPTVEYLAYGKSCRCGCLITRALPDSESVAEYYWKTFVRNGADPQAFLARFAPFLQCVFRSGLFHPDFHLGNVLYEKARQQFALVDVKGARRAGFLDRRFRSYRMLRIAMELREILSKDRMIAFLVECGIPNADAFYEYALRREANALWREWPKRQRQILSGYPKFTRKINGVLRAVNPLRELEELSNCDIRKGKREELEKLFLASFFLQLALIPHRRALGFDPENGKLYLEPVSREACPDDRSDRLRDRLEAFGFPPEPVDWLLNGTGEKKAHCFLLERIARYL